MNIFLFTGNFFREFIITQENFIKYLRTLGFSVTNDIFAENAWYFRNALVRANYTNLPKGIHETTEYIEVFLRNLLLEEKNELHNRNLHISGLLKVDIQDKKVDIETPKVDIESLLSGKVKNFSAKIIIHIHRLFEKFEVVEVHNDNDNENGYNFTDGSVLHLLFCKNV